MLVINKTKIPQPNQSGVYEINCEDCEAVYIGQTGRSLEKRLKEHRNSIINNTHMEMV